MDKMTRRRAERTRREKSTWIVGGMEVKAAGVYEALFVEDPRGCYRQCAVYAILERAWWKEKDLDFEEIDGQFEFYCDVAHRFRDPIHVDMLLEEMLPLVGSVGLKATSCDCCEDMLDVDELRFSSCCDTIVCGRCLIMGDGEHCGACGHNFSPVEVLGLLADE